MKNTKNLLTATILSGLVFASLANTSSVYAVYGSDVILGTTDTHEVVDAGLEDISTQLSLAGIAFLGMTSTVVLFKKLK